MIAAATVALAVGNGRTERAVAAGSYADLESLPCPSRFPVELESFTPQAVSAAERGRFLVAGVPTHLQPPVDWERDPIGSRVYRGALVDLTWMDPLFYAYASTADTAAVEQAKELLLDFAENHPVPDRKAAAAVWERKRTGDRLLRLVYILRAAACSHQLTKAEAKTLLAAARRHANFLRRRPNSKLRSNHDLVQDLALMGVGRYLPFLNSASSWYANGDRRFRSGIAKLVDLRTAIHLEHTASYQGVSIVRVESYLDLAVSPPADLANLVQRMEEVASWFTMPDGTFAPLGDTPFAFPAPAYALADSDEDRGLSPTRVSGYEMVKEPRSYLVTTAGYHRPSHKQADELSFDLYEDSRRVIVDSGRENPGRGPRGAKRYSLASQAHSTLTVDSRSFPLDGDFYGSALDAKGEGDGWFAIEGHNPLLAPQHVRHHRLFLYRPGVALVIVDMLKSRGPHAYQRYIQVDPALKAKKRPSGVVRLRGSRDFAASVWAPGVGRGVTERLLRGQSHPLRGWYSPPGISRLRPRDAIELGSHGRSRRLLSTIAMGREPVTGRPTADGAVVRLPASSSVRLRVRRRGTHLGVSSTPVG